MENEGQVGGENTGKGIDAYVTHRRTLGVAVPRRGRKDENWNDEIRRTRKTSNWVRLLGHSVVKGINSTVRLYCALMCANEDGGNNREGSRRKRRMEIGAGDRMGPPIVFIRG
jgi:hypothetical protein